MRTPQLDDVLAWDVTTTRGCVSVLADVTGRLPSWRNRVESVGRRLETTDCWSGPAATVAAAAVVELSTVATEVVTGVLRSLDALERLAGATAAAHEKAVEALALAAAADIRLDHQGRPDPPVPLPVVGMSAEEAARLAARGRIAAQAADLAAEALRHGALAIAAASEAERALGRLGVFDAFAPLAFPLLAAEVGPVEVAVAFPPSTGGPDQVAAWWAGLSLAAQVSVIVTQPNRLGGLDGVPAWARDRSNRILLARALATSQARTREVAEAVAAQLGAQESAGRQVQLLELDLFQRQAVVAIGDLDTADVVGVLVPGIRTTVEDHLGGMLVAAENVAGAVRAAAPELTVATVAWLGYASPQTVPDVLSRSNARRGGAALDATLDGLAAARQATGSPQPRTTVLAHSYGTVVADEAAIRPGRLAANAVVLMGSPGMTPDGPLRDEVLEVYDAVGGVDLIGVLPFFGGAIPGTGMNPWRPAYGAVELPTEWDMGHSDYYDPDRPTLAAIGEVVAGTRAPG